MAQTGTTILASLAALLAGATLWRIEVLAQQPVPVATQTMTSDPALLARLEAVEQQLAHLTAKPAPTVDSAQLAAQLSERLQRNPGGGMERTRTPLPEPGELAATIAQERGLDADTQARLATVLAEQRTAAESLRERFRRGEAGDDPRQAIEQLRSDTVTKLAAILPPDHVEAVMERLRPSRRGQGDGGPKGLEAPAPPTGAAQF